MHIFDPQVPNNTMPMLPLELDFKNLDLLIQLNRTNIALGELNTQANAIPNKKILIEFSSIKEGVQSNAIEDIHTTIEEAFVAELVADKNLISKENKETLHYKEVILQGARLIEANGALLTRDIINFNILLLEHNQGILSSPNKHIMKGGEILYTPPQGIDLIKSFLGNFEQYYNTFSLDKEIDPLLKLPMLHYQFEAIHPFGDGNGRIGRALAVLYLYLHKKLTSPILFLSESIIQQKSTYYSYLHDIDRGEPQALLEFSIRFLKLIEKQAQKTAETIKGILMIMSSIKKQLKNPDYPILVKMYSHDLLNYLFMSPYYSITGLAKALDIHTNTASVYLKSLEEVGILRSIKMGRNKYYVQPQFLNLLKG